MEPGRHHQGHARHPHESQKGLHRIDTTGGVLPDELQRLPRGGLLRCAEEGDHPESARELQVV